MTNPPTTTALITGGAGFIGSHLAERLLAQGCRVVAVDDLSTGSEANVAHLPPDRFKLVRSAVVDAMDQLRARQFDEVYHLAAGVGVDLVLERPLEVIEGSLRNAVALLEAARSWGRGGRACPVLMASSSEVYGKSAKVPFREDDDVVYGPTTMTRWSYAYAKGMDEFVALSYHARHQLPVVLARFFNTVGPRQSGSWGMVLPRFVQAALQGQPLRIFGDGTQQRCFCDVRDVVSVLPALLRNPACRGGVYNVGSSQLLSIRQLAETVIQVLGSTSRLELVPYDHAYGPGFEDVAVRQPDLTRLETATGFEPTITIMQTIRDLAESMESVGADRTSASAAPGGE
ncbi:MAG: GDP-mannose 4,6-dehydratase [Phycisphaerales bacterium]|nr:GDP-mannose 4,6-dehydratase [Phycisphaerales bacterium]